MPYSTEELLQCIFDCMTESLPDSWTSTSLQASVSGADVKSAFRYVEEGSDKELEFTLQNFVAPLNAVIELQKMATNEGQAWNSITIEINRDGQLRYAVR